MELHRPNLPHSTKEHLEKWIEELEKLHLLKINYNKINNQTIIIINMATTASLELINPYAKFGLKRRPTYIEIANLKRENEPLTEKLPNRDATFFKSSPQGSFFDGSDH